MLSSRAPSLQALLRQSSRLLGPSRSRRSVQQNSWRAMSHCYKYPRPSVTVDVALVGQPEAGSTSSTKLLLIQRKNPPCQGQWALPGGFVDENEPLDKAAARELQEETSVSTSDVDLIQVGAFGDPGRDPRGWCVSVAYAALLPSTVTATAADDAAEAEWWDVKGLPALAFDHKLMVRTAFQHILDRHAAKGEHLEPRVREDLQQGSKALEGPWTPPKD